MPSIDHHDPEFQKRLENHVRCARLALQQLRTESGLTQEEVASRGELPLRTVRSFEDLNRRTYLLDEIVGFCQAFGINLEKFYGRVEELEYALAIGMLLRQQREERGWSRDQLAQRAGVPVAFIENVETQNDLDPDGYLMYRVVVQGLGLDLPNFLRKARGDELPEEDAPEAPHSEKGDGK